MRRARYFWYSLTVTLAVVCGTARVIPAQEGQAAVEALLATDRQFGLAGSNAVDAMAAIFAPDVAMQAPGGFIEGREAVVAALRGQPIHTNARATWRPIRAGVSADAAHGFTFGYLTLTRPDSAPIAMKYMAWWVRRDGEWRVAVYKRGAAGAGAPSDAILPPSLPTRMGVAMGDAAVSSRQLAAAERAFSDLAGQVGLREAFRRIGAPDAVNMGGASSPSFVHGPDAIAELVGRGEPATGGSPLRWASDRVLVAGSGDLGVSIGTILAPPRDPGGAQVRIPFFTIWRRETPASPWRYIAE